MGWERRPVVPRDLLNNRSILAWITGSAVLALSLLTVRPFAGLLHAGAVPQLAALLAVGAAIALPLWLEIAKRVTR